MSNENVLKQYDDWLKDDSKVAAFVMRQWLKPVEEVAFGDENKAVIFPPTYATGDNESPYNIDRFDDKTSVCQIDSVGSQANRMEPIFEREEYKELVPQVFIKRNSDDDNPLSLLEAGHRAADAVVRFTFGPTAEGDDTDATTEPLGQQLWNAYEAWHRRGDAEKLARIAPTSIVFGSWDSRATQAKLPRIVRSVIRAYNVKELHRSAQYSTIAGQILGEGEAETKTEGAEAELGLAHVPAVKTHGGIEVLGSIRRDAMINLVALRSLGVTAKEDEKPEEKEERELQLRRYILGLALIAFTADQDGFLREGCHLVPDKAKPVEWSLVKHDGSRDDPPDLTPNVAKTFAVAATAAFIGQTETITATFAPELAQALLSISNADERKKLLRSGPITTPDTLRTLLDKLNANKLKSACERYGLATNGNRAEYVTRLAAFYSKLETGNADEEESSE